MAHLRHTFAVPGHDFGGTFDDVKFAARFPLRLVEEIERLASSSLSSAEICRRAGDRAEELGVPRPNYERVRELVTEIRRRPVRPSLLDAFLDDAFRAAPPGAVLRHLTGEDR